MDGHGVDVGAKADVATTFRSYSNIELLQKYRLEGEEQ